MTTKCNNCDFGNINSSIDTNNTKEVFQSTDINGGYIDIDAYSIYGVCRRCNQHSVLLKTDYRKSSHIQNIFKQCQYGKN